MLLYYAETLTLLSTEAFDRKLLCDFRVSSNSELCKLLNEIDFVQRINIQRVCWLGHVVRMEKDASARYVFDLRKSTKSITLFALMGSNRGNPIIDCCRSECCADFIGLFYIRCISHTYFLFSF